MKYTSQIIVEAPLEQFIKKFNSYDNRKHWQLGFESFEHIHGDPGKTGSKMKLNYNFGKRKMTIVETIIENRLPNKLYVSYNTKLMHNIQYNYFEETSNGYTKWVNKNEFIPISFFMRFLTLLAPKSFKKQTVIYLNDFKNFVEKNTSVNNA